MIVARTIHCSNNLPRQALLDLLHSGALDESMLWDITIFSKTNQPDREARRIAAELADLGFEGLAVHTARVFLLEAELKQADAELLARELLADPVIEQYSVVRLGEEDAATDRFGDRTSGALVQVLLKPGVTDPVAVSTEQAIADMGYPGTTVRTLRRIWLTPEPTPEAVARIAEKVLANDVIEQVVRGPLRLDHLGFGEPYQFDLVTVPLRDVDDAALEALSREGQLFLSLTEMQTIRGYFRDLGRDPTDAELETLAQTWSEHCSHKTLRGRIRYRDENGERTFENLLKETVFAATEEIRRHLGEQDWCVSVFEDNAGIVRFDDTHNVCFKVETHNHPSALEPYGGANTGIGGVIRDVLGTGLGARPVCNTDVFCFAPPETPLDDLPPGVLHPKKVMRGVVSGVRDYGNRMGIPTVSGAVFFDPHYAGNPLVYCGTVGVIPRDRCSKGAQIGDYVVALGGRTGRDGIHGATFSSAELTHESETVSGGAVQIGNAITEKMVLDVLLEARDRGLYTDVTDCGAGGFSSAVGEMGARLGAEVWLERVPLKYEGLSYTETWISEAQERMVLAVAPEHWDELERLCLSEGVEATVIGRFQETGRLSLKYADHVVGDLDMNFLHEGRPRVIRDAVYEPPAARELLLPEQADFTDDLKRILGSLNVCSKHWIIRQYDHEVQAGTVIKPLVGACSDGPSDAAVVCPVLGSRRGLAIACGMNPLYGDLDPYQMAASAIDEAVRNCVAVGADPGRIALLDNFCWANTDRPEVLGSLVRAALACRDVAVAYGTPFISGKDSLNNEFHPHGGDSKAHGRIAIPPSLLISAMGQVDDVERCVTMDLKKPGNPLYLVGETKDELGGSHYALIHGLEGGQVPRVDAATARDVFARIHEAIVRGLVRACHDLSEGGLAVALAEMAFAGNQGASIHLSGREAPAKEAGRTQDADQVRCLFSESNSRFVVEVRREQEQAFVDLLTEPNASVPLERLGEVTDDDELVITGNTPERPTLIRSSLASLKECWQRPLDW